MTELLHHRNEVIQ